MAYAHTNGKGRTYYLHSKDLELSGGGTRTIFYFSSNIGDGALDRLPEGKVVMENPKTGLPILKVADGTPKGSNGNVSEPKTISAAHAVQEELAETDIMLEDEETEENGGLSLETEENPELAAVSVEKGGNGQPVFVENSEEMETSEQKIGAAEVLTGEMVKVDTENLISNKHKSKTNPLVYLTLAGQLPVVLTANLVMFALTKLGKK